MIQRNTALLLVLLIVLTGGVLFFVLKPSTLETEPEQQQVPPSSVDLTPTIERKAILKFDQPSIQVNAVSDQTREVTIVLDGQDHQITGVQVEASYDPAVLSNVSIAPSQPSFFGPNAGDTIVLHRDINEDLGKITYIAGMSPQSQAHGGVGNVAVLSFRLKSTSTATKTEIVILASSIVTQENVFNASVLNYAEPIRIDIIR